MNLKIVWKQAAAATLFATAAALIIAASTSGAMTGKAEKGAWGLINRAGSPGTTTKMV